MGGAWKLTPSLFSYSAGGGSNGRTVGIAVGTGLGVVAFGTIIGLGAVAFVPFVVFAGTTVAFVVFMWTTVAFVEFAGITVAFVVFVGTTVAFVAFVVFIIGAGVGIADGIGPMTLLMFTQEQVVTFAQVPGLKSMIIWKRN